MSKSYVKKLLLLGCAAVVLVCAVFTGLARPLNAAQPVTPATEDIGVFSARTIWKSNYGAGGAAHVRVGRDLAAGTDTVQFFKQAGVANSKPSAWGTRAFTQKQFQLNGLSLKLDYGGLQPNCLFTVALPRGDGAERFPAGSWSSDRNVLFLRFYRGDGVTKIYGQTSDANKIYFNMGNISVANNTVKPLRDLVKSEVSFAANAAEGGNALDLNFSFDTEKLNIALTHSGASTEGAQAYSITKAQLLDIYGFQTAQAAANDTIEDGFDAAEIAGSVYLMHYSNDNRQTENELSVCVSELTDADDTAERETVLAPVFNAANAYLTAARGLTNASTAQEFQAAAALRDAVNFNAIPISYRWERYAAAQIVKEGDAALYPVMAALFDAACTDAGDSAAAVAARELLSVREKLFRYQDVPTYLQPDADDAYTGARDAEILSGKQTADAGIAAAEELLEQKADYSVTIRVQDETGAPLSGAVVTAGGITATDHSDGSYTLAHLSYGATAQVALDGYRTEEFALSYTDTEKTVTLEKATYTAVITVVGHASGVTFALGGAPLTPASADGDAYAFAGLSQETTITVRKSGYDDAAVTVSQTDPEKSVTLLEAEYTAVITVAGHTSGVMFAIGSAPLAPTSADGDAYSFSGLRGEQAVTVSKIGYESQSVTVSAGGPATSVTLQNARFTAVITVAGHTAGVAFTVNGAEVSPSAVDGEKYTFANLAEETTFTVSKEGYLPQEVKVGFTALTQTVELVPDTYIARITLTDANGRPVTGAQVCFEGREAVEVADGVYELGGLRGECALTVTFSGKTVSVTVSKGNSELDKQLDAGEAEAPDHTALIVSLSCVGGACVIAAAVFVVLYRKRKKHESR